MRHIHLTIILFFSITLFSARSQNLYKDVRYYTDTSSLTPYQKERCRLDIHIPKGTEDCATVIFFHGGGITGGEKFIPYAIQSNGLIGVGVNYRLSPHAKCPAYLEDAAAAVAYIYHHIEEYGGDRSKVYVTGASAGAYLTAMLAMDTTYLLSFGVHPDSIAGYLPLSPQTTTHFTVLNERGISAGSDTEVIDRFAPLYFNRTVIPPMLFVIGDRKLEMSGRYDQNITMVDQLRRNGTTAHLWEFKGKDHNEQAGSGLMEVCRSIKNNLFHSLCDSIFYDSQPNKLVTKDLFYRGDWPGGYTLNQRLNCTLDISMPDSIFDGSTLIYFQSEDLKQSSKTIPSVIPSSGMIGVGVKMRVTPSVSCKETIEDAAAAVAYIYHHIEKYGGDRSKVYVTGASAGAYLTAMLAMDTTYLLSFGVHPDSIAAYFSISSHMTTHPTILEERGGIVYNDDAIDEFAPLYFDRAMSTPFVLIVGDRYLEIASIFEQNSRLVSQLRFPNSDLPVALWQLCTFDHNEIVSPALQMIVDCIRRKERAVQDSLFYEVLSTSSIQDDRIGGIERRYQLNGQALPSNSSINSKSRVEIVVTTDFSGRTVSKKVVCR